MFIPSFASLKKSLSELKVKSPEGTHHQAQQSRSSPTFILSCWQFTSTTTRSKFLNDNVPHPDAHNHLTSSVRFASRNKLKVYWKNMTFYYLIGLTEKHKYIICIFITVGVFPHKSIRQQYNTVRDTYLLNSCWHNAIRHLQQLLVS